MLFYSRMRWELKGMNFEQLWKLEGEEAKAAVRSIEEGFVKHLYKVGGEQYVISIGQSNTMEEFDRYAMGMLPMREHLIFEEVLTLEEGFTIDVVSYLRERRAKLQEEPKFLYFVSLAWEDCKRVVDEIWNEVREQLKEQAGIKVLGVYRVAGRQKVIAIVDVADAGALNSFSLLPALKSPDVERIWALRDYIGFAEDVWRGYKFD